MKKCSICGKPFKINNSSLLEKLSAELQEKIGYIPDCDCFEKENQKIFDKLEQESQQKCIENKLKTFKDISIIDEKFLNSTFQKADMSSDVMKLSKQYTELFITKGTAPVGLLFHGNVGTGKTFASACISNKLIEARKMVMVLSIGLYMNKLLREWAEAENDVLKRVRECDLLVIDDLGVEKITEYVKDKVFMLIDTRYRTGKPVIVTTNLVLTNKELKTQEQLDAKLSIESRFGSRISDRLAEMCQVCCVKGDSKRGIDTRKKFVEFMRGV